MVVRGGRRGSLRGGQVPQVRKAQRAVEFRLARLRGGARGTGPCTVTTSEGLGEAVTAAARRGYGWVAQEPEEVLRSLAAPVTDGDGQVVAAVNVALHAGRTTPEESLAILLPHPLGGRRPDQRRPRRRGPLLPRGADRASRPRPPLSPRPPPGGAPPPRRASTPGRRGIR
ncbi:IclR family transcriptional regulator C-terminal domain-containing protein [Streptomyces sp. NPDC058092]|uniref:IclR family transcriptional regulator domain-containing protein n=1 Tax=Streptomyces sp. NPDC058092 TaxID=3346336 RepID=UPI0036F03494